MDVEPLYDVTLGTLSQGATFAHPDQPGAFFGITNATPTAPGAFACVNLATYAVQDINPTSTVMKAKAIGITSDGKVIFGKEI